MKPSRRLRLSFFSVLGLVVCAVGPVFSSGAEKPDWKVVIPPPGPEERKLGVLIGKWHYLSHKAKRGTSCIKDADTTWEGKWVLDGHLLSLTAKNPPLGEGQKELDVLGYSDRAKRYYMMVITPGGEAADTVEVSWFTIDGNFWRFAPTEQKIGDKIVRHRVTWEINTPDLTTTLVESSEDGVHWVLSTQGEHRRMDGGVTPGVVKSIPDIQAMTRSDEPQERWKLPPPGPEMAIFSAWVGKWTNKHQEKDFYVDGNLDSKLFADRYFLAWFETNRFVYGSGKKESQKEVDIWGYSDTANLYFRFDVATYEGSIQTAEVALTAWWFGRGSTVVLAAPLYEKKIGDRVVPSRFGIALESPDLLTVFEEDLEDGVHWTAPRAILSKTRLP